MRNSPYSITILLAFAVVFLTCFTSCEKSKHQKGTYKIIKDAVTDIDGNHYDGVQIGEQIWTIQNINTTRYADGTEIPLTTLSAEDYHLHIDSAYRWAPQNVNRNVDKFGWLYSWPAIIRDGNGSESNPSGVQGICPNGWHVPSDAEWTELTDYVSKDKKMCCQRAEFAIAKALAAQTDWSKAYDKCDIGYNLSENNATGFSALPAGDANFDYDYRPLGTWGFFWTATYDSGNNSYRRCFCSENDNVDRSTASLGAGYSVRCVKD